MILWRTRIAFRQLKPLAHGCESRLTILGSEHIARGISSRARSRPQERARHPVWRNHRVSHAKIRQPIRRSHVYNHPRVDRAETEQPTIGLPALRNLDRECLLPRIAHRHPADDAGCSRSADAARGRIMHSIVGSSLSHQHQKEPSQRNLFHLSPPLTP